VKESGKKPASFLNLRAFPFGTGHFRILKWSIIDGRGRFIGGLKMVVVDY